MVELMGILANNGGSTEVSGGEQQKKGSINGE